MVFGCNDNSCCSGCFGYTAPLAAIEISGIENIFGLCAFTPFFISKRIRTKMSEEIELHVMPFELSFCRHRLCTRKSAKTQSEKKKYYSHINSSLAVLLR